MRRHKLVDDWEGYFGEYRIKEEVNEYEKEYMEEFRSYILAEGLEDWEILLVRD